MTKDSITLSLEPRESVGKSLGALRKGGLVPAVIHNHGKESTYVQAKYLDLERVVQKAGKHAPVDLTVGSKKQLALIKDVDLHPTKRELRHVVFQSIRQDEKTKAEIPVHIEGDAPAERVGLIVLKTLDHVEVEALPRDLPDELTVDGTKLAEIGDRLTVGDIQVPSGVEILTDPEQLVVVVEEPRVVEEPVAEEAEGEEGAEGEAAEGETKEGEEKPAAETENPAEG